MKKKFWPLWSTSAKWVCEILSPSDWAHDTQHKKTILEEHGISHYWLVDPRQQSIHVFELETNKPNYQLVHSVKKEEER